MKKLFSKVMGIEQEKVTDCVGLYISPTDMYVAQAVKKSNGITVEGRTRVPVPPIDKALLKPLDLNEGFFTRPEDWLLPLRKAMERKKWNTNKIVVSLSSNFSILRHFVMPSVGRRYWRQSIPLQARKYIHYPFEKGIYSYDVYELETAITKQKKLGVVFAMTSKKIVQAVTQGLKSAGFDGLGVEIASFSIDRIYTALDKEAVANKGRIYSFFGTDSAELTFINNRLPLLIREMDISGPLPIERRRLEIGNYTDFISKQLEKDPFYEVVVMGQNMEEWTPVLESDARKPVRQWNIKENLGFEPKSIGELAAVGACSKFVDDTIADVDLSGRKRITKQEISAVTTMWRLAFIVILMMFALIGLGKINADNVSNRLLREQTQVVKISDFSGMGSAQVVEQVNKMSSKKLIYDRLLNAYTVTPVLVSLARVLPTDMWVSKVSYRQPFDLDKGFTPPELTLEGFIATPKGEWKTDIELGTRFKDIIAADPVFMPVCKPNLASKGPEITFPVATGNESTRETRFILKCLPAAAGGKK